ncbi:MAG TPA: CoA-binding protein [Kofleriaceae bacterium]|jgi:hypothetical protein
MSPDDVSAILATSPTVAVLGISASHEKPAHYVPDYLFSVGYRILGVNPALAGQTMFAQPVVATLADLTEPIDLLDVFRRAELIPAHVPEILAMNPRPRVVWFQLGIRNDEAAAALEAEGITVVQDRCTLADHRRFGLGRPKRR